MSTSTYTKRRIGYALVAGAVLAADGCRSVAKVCRTLTGVAVVLMAGSARGTALLAKPAVARDITTFLEQHYR